MIIEAGKEYKARTDPRGRRTPGGSYRVRAITGGQVKFEVLESHGASAGGLFTMDAAKFEEMIEEAE